MDTCICNGQNNSSKSEKLLFEGNVTVYTDKGEITLSVEGAETDWAKFDVKVTNKGGKTFYRTLTVFCKSDLTLYEIRLSIPSPKEENEFVFYAPWPERSQRNPHVFRLVARAVDRKGL